jgi:long-chain acyl-CoA synthetase
LEEGDRVGLFLPNCPQMVIGYYAALRCGCTVVMISPLSVERELEHIINDSGLKTVICLDLFWPRVENVWEKAGLKRVIVTSVKEYLPFPKNLLFPLVLRKKGQYVKIPDRPNLLWFKDLLTESDPPFGVPGVDPRRDVAVIIYTGGTTGVPKGVMLTHFAVIANTMQLGSWITFDDGDILLGVLPIFHGFGMSLVMNTTLLEGGTALLIPRFEPGELLKDIEKYRPTLFAGVPTMYIGLLNHPDFKTTDISSLRGCFVGAAPLPLEVKRRFEELTGGSLIEGYGLTEAVTAQSANPYLGKDKAGSIGIPFPDVEFKVVDVDEGSRELPPGEEGELILRSPCLMKGYHNLPGETDKAIRGEWLYTGDIARMDEEGYFYIVDRKKDMIIAGGFNVYPAEVEDVIYLNEKVAEAAVIGIPDEYRGENIKAFVVLKEGEEMTGEELISFCRERIAAYKIPRVVEFRDDLPKSVIGKILRKELKEKS